MKMNTHKISYKSLSRDQRIPSTLLRFDANSGEMVESQNFEGAIAEPFLKGPILIAWLSCAAHLPGKTFNTALAIQWLAGMNANKPFKLTRKALELFNVSNDAAIDALNRMSDAGLVKLQKKPGQRPMIEVLPVRSGK